jgi:hypothetical protein
MWQWQMCIHEPMSAQNRECGSGLRSQRLQAVLYLINYRDRIQGDPWLRVNRLDWPSLKPNATFGDTLHYRPAIMTRFVRSRKKMEEGTDSITLAAR